MEEEKMAANIAVRAALDGIKEIMGENGCKIVFKNAELSHIFENPPEYDWEPCITITQQGRLYPEIANLLGLKGALGVWRRIGYTNIKYAAELGHILDAFTELESKEKFNKVMEILQMGIGVGRMVAGKEGIVEYDVFDCPVCLEYKSERSVCTVITGSIQYIANWAYGDNVKIAKEIKCKAKGDDSCYFVIEDKD
jgi:predicted hydrocarbon binding protein